MKNIITPKIVSLFLILFASVSSWAVPNSITLQLKIFNPAGATLQASAVHFRFTTVDLTGTCILYVEDFASQDLRNTDGSIAFSLGSGTKVYPVTAYTYPDLFNNLTPSFACQGGGTYSPHVSHTDGRRIVVQFNDGSGTGWQSLDPIQVSSVPYASYSGDAEKFAGVAITDFLRKSTLPTCTGSDVLTFNGTTITCTAGGGGGGGGGGVTSVTAAATAGNPITIGGTASAPTVAIPVASSTTNGYLSSANWTTFNGKQNALGYTPLNPANNLSDVATVATARTNLGLGGAAVLNVGTSAGTVAAGNDSRITGALQSGATAGGDLTGTYPNPTLAAIVTAATYPKITFDAKGRVTAGALLTDTDIPNLDAAKITTGTFATARLGSGTASASTYLRGDGSWASLSATQWTTTGSNIYYNAGNVGVGTNNPAAATLTVIGPGGTVSSPNAISPLSVTGGTGHVATNGNGGNISLTAGSGGGSGAGGSVTLQAGAGNGAAGGSITIASSNSASGAITIQPGQGDTSGGSGALNLYGAVGGANTIGGLINIVGGTGGSSGNAGGAVNITGGAATGTNKNGASVVIDGGAKTGTGTDGYVLLASTRGNVGIGTATPTAKLEVAGTIKITGGSPGAGKVLTSDASGNASWQAGAAGGVTSVSAASTTGNPITIGGTAADPTVAIPKGSGTTNGYIDMTDWTTFNSKQAALGYTPLNPANNLSDVAAVATARTNLGLGGAATLNVGTAAGTVAAGNDSRITGALQASNNLSDLGTVATARTNLGLGTAAVLNVGTGNNQVVQLDGSAALPAVSGVNVTNLNGSNIASGTVATARLGSGTANSTTFLRGDGTWASSTPANSLTRYRVRAATTANITLSGTQTIDGVAVIAGDRVLVKNQTTLAQNGVYVVAAGAWTRATDLDTWSEARGYIAVVDEGNIWEGATFVASAMGASGTLGSTDLEWSTASFMTALYSTAFGDSALTQLTTGGWNTVLGSKAANSTTTGSYNTAVGSYALRMNTTGASNTALGYRALRNATGSSNIAIGMDAGYSLTTGSNNVIIGSNTASTFATSSNNISINDGAGNERIRVLSNGNTGIGESAPTAVLHLKAGTATAGSAPLKFTSGPLLTAVENGTMEYDGTDFYVTTGGTRRTIASNASAGNFTGVSSIANSGGNISLSPSAAGSVSVTASTPSTTASSGALVVSGGVGIGGALNVTSNIYSSANIQAATSILSPIIYGGTTASQNLTLESTSNSTKGKIILNGDVQITGGTPGAGKVLTSDASGNASWVTSSALPSDSTVIYKTRVATTANITLSGTQTIDGVAVVAGDRVLVKNQSTDSQNGVYVVAAGAWTRASDLDTWAETNYYTAHVSEGSLWGGTNFVLNANATGTIGTTSISWDASGTVGSTSTVLGSLALNGLTTGTGNSAFGNWALRSNTTGNYNSAFGLAALALNADGEYNTAIGGRALYIATGSSNIGIGYNAGSAITTGTGNVVIGQNTGSNFATGTNNISISDGAGNERIRVLSTGNTGIGESAPTAVLHLKAGAAAAGSAPLKFTSGPLLTTVENGSMEYDGTSFYLSSGGTRRTIASGSAAGTIDGASTINNSAGNITMNPAAATGSVLVTSTTTSTSASTGALVVSGGVGVAGALNVTGNILSSAAIQGGSLKATGQMSSGTQTISGGTTAINWDNGNIISTDYNCASPFAFANLRDGGTYTLIVTSTATTQCTFSATSTGTDAAAGTLTYRFKPANAARTASTHTIYTLMRVGTKVYVSWASDF